MSGYYIYLISSLPMLHFGLKPPISFERFIRLCQGLLSEEDIEILKVCAQQNIHDYKTGQPTLNKWRVFDTALRNELVKIRAGRKKV